MAKRKITERMVLTGMGIACICLGCTRQIYVPAERIVRDTVMQTKVRTDSLRERDSIYVGMRGDTAVKEVWRWRTRTRTRVDTVYRTRVDSVPVIVPAASGNKPESRESKIAKTITWGTRLGLLLLLIIAVWPRLIQTVRLAGAQISRFVRNGLKNEATDKRY